MTGRIRFIDRRLNKVGVPAAADGGGTPTYGLAGLTVNETDAPPIAGLSVRALPGIIRRIIVVVMPGSRHILQRGMLLLPTLCVSAACAAPRIEAPQSAFDFGWRDSAETVTNRFVLRNAGDGPLYLTDIRTSCGCTRAEPARRALEPGEETELEVRTALRGLNGRIRKSVTVTSNDPDTPYLSLWVEGDARAAVSLEPPSVSFGRIDPSRPPASETVRLTGYLTNVTIRAATSDTAAFTLTRASDGRSLTVTPPLAPTPGVCRGLAHVTLSDPSQPTLALPLYAWVDDLIRIAPPALAFRPSAQAASVRLIIVRPGTAKRFRITAADVEGGSGAARVMARPGGNYQIALEGVIPDALATNAALVIRTDLAGRPEWRVPLRIEGRRAP